MNKYPHLFSPIRLGALELPNRVVLAPMATNYAGEDHKVTDRLIAYHVARAEGGVGLSIVEHTAVQQSGLTSPRMLAILDDSFIPGHKRLVDAVHEAGGRIALQIQHGGRQADPNSIGGQCISPSAVVAGRDRRMPREMTVKEIRATTQAFGEGALRAKKAGYDGVEVHMAHGYLGCSFLSPLLNQRTDAYGGDTVKRTRFAFEVMQEIRRRCGRDYSVWCRISADEFLEGGMKLDEALRVARLLEEYGYCAMHVSACVGETSYYASAPWMLPEGHLLHLSEAISRTVQVPVIGVGNIRHPAFAEDAIAHGRCDLVALGRQLLADADWVRKAQEDRADRIIPCILCNQACMERRHSPEGFAECVTNPLTAHEVDWPDWPEGPAPAATKRVLVVGGGPAGISAAVTAARRGHKVTLWERGPILGGRIAALAWPDKSHVLDEYVNCLAGQIDESGVEVYWQRRADAQSVAEFAPDELIIATGSRPLDPGEVLPEDCDGEFVQAIGYLQDPAMDLPELVAVLGGDRVGLVSALELARNGHEVLLFEQNDQVGMGVPPGVRHFLLKRIEKARVHLLTGHRVQKVLGSVVTALVHGEERREFPPAGIVCALGRAAVDPWPGLRAEGGGGVHIIGDALQPRTLHDAVWEGAEIGRRI